MVTNRRSFLSALGLGPAAIAAAAALPERATIPPLTAPRPVAPAPRMFRQFVDFHGPIGCGTSYALREYAASLAVVNKGCTGIVASPAWAFSWQMDAMREMLEKKHVEYTAYLYDARIVFPRFKSTILFRSLENPIQIRGLNLGWFVVDHMADVDAADWNALALRLRDPQAACRVGASSWWDQEERLVRRKNRFPLESYALRDVVVGSDGLKRSVRVVEVPA